MRTRARGYTLVPYSRLRRAAQDLEVLQRPHLIHALLEANVSWPRAAIDAHEKVTGEHLSFTAFLVTCVARAVDEDKIMHAYRKGRRHLILYEDVDVAVLVDLSAEGQHQAVYHIIRAANRKSLCQIHGEIRNAQSAQQTTTWLAGVKVFQILPGWLRRRLLRTFGRWPGIWRARGGTVAVTEVGMLGRGGGWGVPMTPNTLAVTVGGIGEKLVLLNGAPVMQEYLSLTISVDHDVVDGGPAARFASRLRELIEQGYGLPVEDARMRVAALAAHGGRDEDQGEAKSSHLAWARRM